MLIQTIILDPGMEPTKIMRHSIKYTFRINILIAPAQISGELAVPFDICKGTFCLDASVHPQQLSFLRIDPFISIRTQTFKFF